MRGPALDVRPQGGGERWLPRRHQGLVLLYVSEIVGDADASNVRASKGSPATLSISAALSAMIGVSDELSCSILKATLPY